MEKKNARLDALKKMQTEADQTAPVTKGRKSRAEKGEEERVPFTTSISIKNRTQLGLFAAHKRARVADVLDEILSEFFEKHG